jgi:hypothetical protein
LKARRIYSDLKRKFLCLRSIVRRRLVEAENPSACVKVDWKVCISDSVVLIVIKRDCNRSANISNNPI